MPNRMIANRAKVSQAMNPLPHKAAKSFTWDIANEAPCEVYVCGKNSGVNLFVPVINLLCAVLEPRVEKVLEKINSWAKSIFPTSIITSTCFAKGN